MKLRNEGDIKKAKEKLKYCILVQEDMLSESMHNLRGNLMLSLRRAVFEAGAKIVTMAIMNYLNERLHQD